MLCKSKFPFQTKDEHYEAKLRIKVVNKELFQSYKLTVTNAEGSNTINIKVQQGKGIHQVSLSRLR